MRVIRRSARRFWRGSSLKGGLRRRILLWFLVLSLVPLFVSNTVGYLVTQRIIEGQIQRYLHGLTDARAQYVATEVERQQLYLEAVANERVLVDRIPAAAALQLDAPDDLWVTALREHLDGKLVEFQPLSELFVVGTSGRVVAATRRSRLGEDWSGSDLFRLGRAGRFIAEAWEPEGPTGGPEPVYRLATPIQDESGRCVGVLAGTVGFGSLRAFPRPAPHIATDVHAFITDSEGYPLFVSHPRATPVDYRKRLPSPLVDRAAGSVARYVNYEGVEVLGTSVAVPGPSWLYISEISVASAFGELRGLAVLAAALEGVFALLLVGVVWIVARSIVAPLRRLVLAAEHIRRGDLSVEVQIERDDELGDLGRTFNQMSNGLRASAREIQELHDQEMRRAAQLASVGELASGIAHEIKNPLVGVASGIDLLSKQLLGNREAEAILSEIRTQIHRLETALGDFLSYARPKQPCLAWTDPQALVERVVTLVHPQAEAAGVRIEQRRAGKIRDVRVDPDLLTQALVNLALNGIQAMESGGVLEISVTSVNDEVRISVSDTGVGIAADEIEKIFRPFHTTKHQGTGLGLAITRGIVERHGGRLEIESELGKGSTFTLVLSATPEEAAVR